MAGRQADGSPGGGPAGEVAVLCNSEMLGALAYAIHMQKKVCRSAQCEGRDLQCEGRDLRARCK